MTTDGDVATLKLSEVSRRSGIDVATLRQLVDDNLLPGVVRGSSGHVYVREDYVPSWSDLVEVIERQQQVHLRRAQSAFDRVRTELEAVSNDLQMAAENPYLELGDDLTAFQAYSNRSDRTTLLRAVKRLEEVVTFRRAPDITTVTAFLDRRR